MSIQATEAVTACTTGLGLALGCGWLCFDSLQRLVLPAFLWGTPLWGGGGAFTVTLAAGFSLWAWKADGGLAARCGAWWTHVAQGVSLGLALGAAATCQAAPATTPAAYLAPLCLGLCGALQCAQWCGLLLAISQDTAWAALVVAATASALLACGCATAPPIWLPWIFCCAVAQAWPLAAWCAARSAAPCRRRGRPPKPKKNDGLLPRLPLLLTGLAYLLCCFASPLTGKELPLWASWLGFITGVIVYRLVGGWERRVWLVPAGCLACCCGILLPGAGAVAALAVAEGCLAAALLALAGKRAEGVVRLVGQTLCGLTLLGNLAAQLGLLGARSDGASHILLTAAACAALGVAVCAMQMVLPLWRGGVAARAARAADPVLGLLTAQERQVFRLLGEGCGNRDIAGRLNISEPTVRFHLRAIYKKTGQEGRPGLEALARRYVPPSGETA